MKVKKKKKCILEKLVKAAILCFHRRGGLQFDGKHNYNHRTSLEVEGLDSYQAIKYYLKVNDISSLEVFYQTECPEIDFVEKHLLNNMINSKKEYCDYLKTKNDENFGKGNSSCDNFKIQN